MNTRKFTHIRQIMMIIMVTIMLLWQNGSVVYSQNCTVNANVEQTICANDPMILVGAIAGLMEGSGTTTWSQYGGPAVTIVSPNSLITPVLGYVPNTTYMFRLTTSCEDGTLVFDTVRINVLPSSVANAGPDMILCPGTHTITANTPLTGETGVWSIIGLSNDLVLTNETSTTCTITLPATSAGATTLRWTITNPNGCSTFDEVIVYNRGGVSPISAGPDQVISACYSTTASAVLNASYAGNGTDGQIGTWTLINGPNMPMITNANLRNTSVYNLIQGIYIFRWTVNGACVSGSDDVQITVLAPVGSVSFASIISGNQVFCDDRSEAILTGTTPSYTNETVLWTQVAGPPCNITNPNSPVTTVTGLDGFSTYSFVYTITNGATGCASVSASRTIRFFDPPTVDAGPDIILPPGVYTANIGYTFTGGNSTQYNVVSYPSGYTPPGWTPTNSPLIITGLNQIGTYVVRFRRYVNNGTGVCADAFDDVNVYVSKIPPGSNAGTDQLLACNVTNTALAGNTPIYGTGTWSQVSGPNAAVFYDVHMPTTPISDLVSGVYIFRWSITAGINSPVYTDDVQVVVVDAIPQNVSAGPDQLVCYGTPVVMQGNTPAVYEIGTWTVTPSAGVTFSNIHAAHAVVNGLIANTTYTFTWTINNACGTVSDAVVITTTNTQGAFQALAGPDQCLPSGTSTVQLAANDPSPASGSWTKISGPTCTITNPTAYNTSVTGMTNGNYLFQWQISVSGCGSSFDTVMVTISPDATIANAGADQNVCGNTTNLNANMPTIGTGLWSVIAGPVGSVISSATSPNTTFNNLSDGVYTVRWTISNYACPSNYDEVQISVSTPPTVANAGPDQNICNLTSATLAANTITSGTGMWSVVSAPATPVFANLNAPTTTVSGLVSGTYTLRWTSSNGINCPVSADDVVLNVSSNANAGPDQNLCDVTSVNLTGNSQSTGTWSFVSGPNVPVISSTGNNTAIVNGLIGGVYVFRYTINDGICPATFDDVTINNFGYGTTPLAGPDQQLCNVNQINLLANLPAMGTGIWTKVSGPAGGSFTPDENTPNAIFTGALPGIYYFNWSVTNGACILSDQVRVEIFEAPTTANAGSDQSVCSNNAIFNATVPTSGVGQWALVSGPGAATITAPVQPASGVSVTVFGTYTFSWTVSNGICPASTDNVQIIFSEPPTTPNAGTDQNLCTVTSVNLSANTPTIGTGNWTLVSGPNTPAINNPSSPATTVTNVVSGTYTFRWTITNAACVLYDELSVNIYDAPTTANAGSDITVCNYAPVSLNANTPASGTGTWSQVSGPNTALINNVNNPLSTVSGTIPGVYVFRWTIANSPCTPSSDDVSVTVFENPSLAVAGADQLLCNAASFSLNGSVPAIGTGLWSLVSGPNTPVFSNPQSPSATVNNVVAGNYVFAWTISNGPCVSTDQVIIQNDPATPVANAGSDQIICGQSQASMSANNPAPGTGTWTLVSGPNTPVISGVNNPLASITGLVNGVYEFRWTITSGSCPSSSDNVILNVSPNSVNANAGPDQNLACGVTATTLAGNNPVSGTGSWSIISGNGGVVASVNNPLSSFTGLQGEVYTLRWAITDGGCNSSDDVQISIPMLPTASNAGPDQTLPSGVLSTILNANVPTVGTGVWTIVSGTGGVLASASAANSGFTGVAGVTYTLEWTISHQGCTSTDQVLITFISCTASADAGPDQNLACGVTSTVLAGNNPAPGTGTWTILSGNGGNISSPNSPVSAFNGQQGEVYELQWTIVDGGCTYTDDVQISIPMLPTASNAGPDQTLPSGVLSTILNANVPTVGTGVWTIVSGTGGVLASASAANSGFTGVAGVTYTLEWTISHQGCTSTDQVLITFISCTASADAGPDQNLACGVTSTVLAGNNPAPGTGTWTILSGNGGNISSPNSPVSAFSGQQGEVYELQWTIVDGGCTYTDEVQISIPMLPTASNAGPDQTLPSGVLSTILNANVPTVGTGVWTIVSGTGGVLASASAANSGFTGDAGETYLLEWTITYLGCTSSDQVQINIVTCPVLADAGPDQVVPCGYVSTLLQAVTPASGSGIWTVVSGTGGSFNNVFDPHTYFYGLFGSSYVLRWTVTDGACITYDEVQITIQEAFSLSNAGPDQALPCGTNSAVLAANTPVYGNGSWSVVLGTSGTFSSVTDPNATFTGQAGQIYILRWTISNGACSSTDDVQLFIPESPSAADAGPDVIATCGLVTANLHAANPTMGSGAWSIISGVGGSFANIFNPQSIFYGLQGETYILEWTVTQGVCTSTDQMQVIIPYNISAAYAGPDQYLACGVYSTGISANAPVSGSGEWTIVSGNGGSFADPLNPVTTFTGQSGETYILRWTISDTYGICTSSDDMQIVIPQNPTTADAGQDIILTCGTLSTTLSANVAMFGNGQWSIISGNGGLIAAIGNPASQFTGVQGQTYVLRWTITLGTCTSTDDVTVTVPATVAAADAGPDQVMGCWVNTTNLAANVPLNGIGSWTIVSGNGGTIADPSSAVSSFTGIDGEIYILSWTVSDSAGLCPTTDDVQITMPVNPTVANAGADQILPQGITTTNLNANLPLIGTGSWTIVSGNGGIITDATHANSGFTGVSGETYTLEWTITHLGCTSTDQVVITMSSCPSVANAGNDQTIPCGLVSTMLSANIPVSGAGIWSVVSGNGGSFNNVLNPNTYFYGIFGETYVLRWTITDGGCVSYDEVQVTVQDAFTISNAGSDQVLPCGNLSTILNANIPVYGTGSWTIISGTGGSFSSITDPYATFTGLSGQIYILRWTISNGACSSSDDVQIFIPQQPSVADAGADIIASCGLVTVNLNAAAPTVGSGSWSIISGVGGSFADIFSPQSVFYGLQGQVYILQWTVTQGVCASTDQVQVMIPYNITAAYAGPDQFLACGVNTANISANAPVSGSGLWTIVAGAGGSIADPLNPVTIFTGQAGQTYILRWTIADSLGICTSSDDIQVVVPQNPDIADAGQDQTLACGVVSATLNANTPMIGNGQWTIVSGAGGMLSNTGDPSALFTGAQGQTYILSWTISLGACTSSDNVQITIPLAGTIAFAGNDQTLPCGTVTTMLNANAAGSGAGLWSIASGNGGSIASPASSNSSFTGVQGETYSLVWTIGTGLCSSSDTVTIIVPLVPTAADAGSDQVLPCNTTSLTLNANTPLLGTGNWNIISGTGGILADASSANSLFTGVPGNTYVLEWVISSGLCSSSDQVQIEVQACPPVAVDDIYQVFEDQVLNGSTVLVNDFDPMGFLLTVNPAPVVNVSNGMLVLNTNGTFIYTPDPDFNGIDSFQYEVCNNAVPPLCDIATVVIYVIPVNDPPVIIDTAGNSTQVIYDTTYADVPLGMCLHAYDVDGDDYYLTYISTPSNGTLSGVGSGDTCFTYIPNSGFVGNDSLIAIICDNGNPVMCDTVSIIITVLPANLPPEAVNDSYTMYEDNQLFVTTSILTNDFDPDNNQITISTFPVIDVIHGGLIIYIDGTFEYFPDPDFYGIDSFQYYIFDNGLPSKGDTGTVIINVLPVNDPPVIVDPLLNPIETMYDTTYVNTPITICVLAIDPDTNDYALNFIGLPVNGFVSPSSMSDSCFIYTPFPGFIGNDTVFVQACDNGSPSLCDSVYVIITVIPAAVANQSPVAVDDYYTVYENDTLFALNSVLLNDYDPDTNLININTTPVQDVTHGSLVINTDGTFVYIPDTGYIGPDSFLYEICDNGIPSLCDTAEVFIQVLPGNNPPIIVDSNGYSTDTIYLTTQVNVPIYTCVSTVDLENDTVTLNFINLPNNGTVSAGGFGDTCYAYTPNVNYIGGDTLVILACDNGVPSLCDSVVVIILVNPDLGNQPPVVLDDGNNPTDTLYYMTVEDTPLYICLNVVDPDNDDMTLGLLSNLSNGTFADLADPDTCFTYIPDLNFFGQDTAVMIVCDNGSPSMCDTVVLIFSVTPLNDPPYVVDDSGTITDVLYYSICQNTPLSACLNIIDPDSNDVTLGAIILPENGVLTNLNDGDWCVGYIPDFNYLGQDTIVLILCDDGTPSLCDTVSLIIDVTLCNNPPHILDSNNSDTDVLWYTTYEETPINICLNVLDVDGDDLNMIFVTGPYNGTISNNADGDTCFTYTPNPGFIGVDSMMVVVCDNSLCDTVMIYIIVLPLPVPELDLFIPQAFSPNGDGVNDYFVITGLEEYPENHMIIYNRWGNKVFEGEPYKNDWDGKYQGKVSIGDELPAGTYFYVLKLTPDSKAIKGYIYLGR